MGDSQYSFLLTTFSPSGKLVQIEHALMAVGTGQTSLGIKAANGVVIATEKKLPSILVDESSVQKIQLLTSNIVVTYSGMGPDSRVLVRKNQKERQRTNSNSKRNRRPFTFQRFSSTGQTPLSSPLLRMPTL